MNMDDIAFGRAAAEAKLALLLRDSRCIQQAGPGQSYLDSISLALLCQEDAALAIIEAYYSILVELVTRWKHLDVITSQHKDDIIRVAGPLVYLAPHLKE
jgi:hypothetical protein